MRGEHRCEARAEVRRIGGVVYDQSTTSPQGRFRQGHFAWLNAYMRKLFAKLPICSHRDRPLKIIIPEGKIAAICIDQLAQAVGKVLEHFLIIIHFNGSTRNIVQQCQTAGTLLSGFIRLSVVQGNCRLVGK